jgi:tetratricopeptide (TPR) repeat protein
MNEDRFVDALFAATCDAEREAIIQSVIAERDAVALVDFAQNVKSYHFDRYLNADLDKAFAVAYGIEQIGHAAHNGIIIALGLLSRGDAERQAGQALTAMGLHQRAGDLFLHASDRIGWARARGGWLVAATHAGRVTEGDLASMDEARQVLKDAEQWFRLAVFEQNIGLAYQYLGRYEESLEVYNHLLYILDTEINIPLYSPLHATLLLNKAITTFYQGDLQAARSLFLQAKEIAVQIGSEGIEGLAYMNVSLIEQLRWHYRDALESNRLAITQLKSAKQFLPLTQALQYRASILLKLNRNEEALLDIDEAVRLGRRLQFPLDVAEILCTQAAIFNHCGKYEEALGCLIEGETLAQAAGYPVYALAIALDQCLLQLSNGAAQTARETALNILKRPQLRGMELQRGLALLLATEATLALGKINWARTMAQAVIKCGEQLDAPELLFRGHLVLARAMRQEGHATEALTQFDQALDYLRLLVGDLVLDQRTQFLEDKDSVYFEALTTAAEAGEPTRALNYLEQLRQRATWLVGMPGDAANGKAQVELAELRQRHRYISESLLTLPADGPATMGAKQELKRLERQIRDHIEAQATRDASSPLMQTAGIEVLPPNLTAVAYALLERDLIIFVIRHGRVVAERVADGARQVRKSERALRLSIDTLTARLTMCASDHIQHELAQWAGPLQGALTRLWDVLIRPVLHLMPPAGAPLVIIPHGALHALPLLALHDGEHYLAERWAVQLVPSLQSLVPKDNHDPAGDEGNHVVWDEGNHKGLPLHTVQGEAGISERMLALGYSHAGSLPSAEDEARQVADLMGGMALVGTAANGERLVQEGARCAYLHVAAHGAVRLDVPNSSFVQLADGPFHPTDILEMDLRQCRLVTLSACETGLGRRSGGDEQIGLARAFGLAGAEAVLATLWRVDDETTRAFMTAFYAHIAAGESPAQALRAAQLTFIHDPAQWRAHPYFWAGFQLTTLIHHAPTGAATVLSDRAVIAG